MPEIAEGLSKISVSQLRAFVHVVDRGGFSRAAAALGTTQPAISHAMTSLERVLGGEVVSRQNRTGLTDLGRDLLPYARSALASMEALMAAASSRTALAGTVRLAVPSTVHDALTPLWTRLWRDALPEVSVRFLTADDEEMLAWLDADVVDAAVLVDPGPAFDAGVVVARDALEAVVRKDHPLAAESSITVTELLDDPLIVRVGGCQGLVLELCRGADPHFTPAHEVVELGALMGMVAANIGVTIIPSLGRVWLTGELTMVPLTPVTRRTLVLTGPANRPWHPLVSALARLVEAPGDVITRP